jgi:hypothetical protein
VKRAGHPPVQRLIIEDLRSALEPETVHENAIAGHLIREPVVDRVRSEMRDLRQRSRGNQREERHADEQQRAAEMPVPFGHGDNDRAGQQQHGGPFESAGHADGCEHGCRRDHPHEKRRALPILDHKEIRPNPR